jgi:hypothetical protein
MNKEDKIELIYSSSTFEKDELNKMSDSEINDLWKTLEMEEWLEELDTE